MLGTGAQVEEAVKAVPRAPATPRVLSPNLNLCEASKLPNSTLI